MSLWPSRGLELHGIEIKCSRGDWLHELKRPDKADKMFKYFDRWWLAVSDESVAHDYEIPPTWGLIVMDKIKANAPILAPEPIDRKFLAAIMRRVYETSPEAKLAAEYARGKEDGYRDGYERGAKSGTAAANLDVLRRNVKAFEDSSGISIGEWNLGDVGRAARALATHGPKRLKANIEGLRNQLGRWAAGLDEVVAAVGELEEAEQAETQKSPRLGPVEGPAGGSVFTRL